MLRTAVYLKLFDAAAQAEKGEVRTQQLASSLGADQALLRNCCLKPCRMPSMLTNRSSRHAGARRNGSL